MEVDNISRQIDEIVALESIYGEDFSMNVSDQQNRQRIEKYLDTSKITDMLIPLQYSITLHVQINEDTEDEDIETVNFCVSIQIPFEYPNKPPTTDITFDSVFTRDETVKINSDFDNYIKSLIDDSNECIFQALDWLENEIRLLVKEKPKEIEKKEENNNDIKSRIWIYFHHIYSSKKRRFIVDLAGQLKLFGFCLSGKPGVICIEGNEAACDEFYMQIRSLAWQKMTVRKRENIEIFNFKEFGFREIQMTTSNFRSFLEDYSCGSIFDVIYQI